MKNFKFPFALFILIIILLSSSFSVPGDLNLTGYNEQDTLIRYKDGTFTGQSRASYTQEPFWGNVKIKVVNGSITSISYKIRDSVVHVTFDANYEKHFQGNPVYIQQCRNDWKGVQTYPKKLSESQDINKVDAISGATWSFNIFKASLKEAMKNAR